MGNFIYEVNLSGGKSNSDYFTFYENVTKLDAKAPDFGGINNMCLISHHMDEDTIQMLCSIGLKKEDDVTVVEITDETLNDESSHHKTHLETIRNCFLQYKDYQNISIS